jgi:protein-disulfide isomerase
LNAKKSAASRLGMTEETPARSWLATVAFALGAALLGFAGGWAFQATGAGRGATEATVRNYILEHPEILPEAMERLQQKEMAARIGPLRGALETAYPGAVLGNPQGTVTLVEFSDYACPYCRLSIPDLKAVIAANPDLKVVMRESPILGDDSVEAARMALAAAEQGRFEAFHYAMFAKDRPTAAAIEAAAREAGVDLAKARAAIATGKYDAELRANVGMNGSIGLTGTPGWVAGDLAFSGAVGQDRLAEAVAKARDAS